MESPGECKDLALDRGQTRSRFRICLEVYQMRWWSERERGWVATEDLQKKNSSLTGTGKPNPRLAEMEKDMGDICGSNEGVSPAGDTVRMWPEDQELRMEPTWGVEQATTFSILRVREAETENREISYARQRCGEPVLWVVWSPGTEDVKPVIKVFYTAVSLE